MKKLLIISGIVFILLMVGFSGCTEFGIEITNIGDIIANPDEYIGKELTIEGDCSATIITDNKGHMLKYEYGSIINGMLYYNILYKVYYMKLDVCPYCKHSWYRRSPEAPVKCPKCHRRYYGLKGKR